MNYDEATEELMMNDPRIAGSTEAIAKRLGLDEGGAGQVLHISKTMWDMFHEYGQYVCHESMSRPMDEILSFEEYLVAVFSGRITPQYRMRMRLHASEYLAELTADMLTDEGPLIKAIKDHDDTDTDDDTDDSASPRSTSDIFSSVGGGEDIEGE